MNYEDFKKRVREHNWSIEELRCDVRPTAELLEFIDEVGAAYEEFVLRLEKE